MSIQLFAKCKIGAIASVDRIDGKHLNRTCKMCAMLDLHHWTKCQPTTSWNRTAAMWWIQMRPTHRVRVKSESCQAKICRGHHHATAKVRQNKRPCPNFTIHCSNHRTKMNWTVRIVNNRMQKTNINQFKRPNWIIFPFFFSSLATSQLSEEEMIEKALQMSRLEFMQSKAI